MRHLTSVRGHETRTVTTPLAEARSVRLATVTRGAVRSTVAVAPSDDPSPPPGIGELGEVVPDVDPLTSVVKVRVAGVGSTLPAASMARARNVCAPSASPL